MDRYDRYVAELPEGYKWFVHITGHEQFPEGPVVFHLFEDESYNYSWEAGKKYEYTFKENPLIKCSFEVGIVNRNMSDDIKDNMIITINFSFDLGLKDEKSNYIENYKTIVINKDGKIEYK